MWDSFSQNYGESFNYYVFFVCVTLRYVTIHDLIGWFIVNMVGNYFFACRILHGDDIWSEVRIQVCPRNQPEDRHTPEHIHIFTNKIYINYIPKCMLQTK